MAFHKKRLDEYLFKVTSKGDRKLLSPGPLGSNQRHQTRIVSDQKAAVFLPPGIAYISHSKNTKKLNEKNIF